MKKINSIGYGGKIVGTAVVFTLVLPVIIKIVMFKYDIQVLATCVRVSFGIGLLIVLFLIVLLAIEFGQDKKMDRYYETQKDERIFIGEGLYECQSCGNKKVKSNDRSCGICGILFSKEREENEQNR